MSNRIDSTAMSRKHLPSSNLQILLKEAVETNARRQNSLVNFHLPANSKFLDPCGFRGQDLHRSDFLDHGLSTIVPLMDSNFICPW